MSDQFQSAPRSFLRGDSGLTKQELRKTVSIRAPQSPAGRLNPLVCWRITVSFQSAPRSLLRGDRSNPPGWRTSPAGFQSAPRSLLRGDLRPRLQDGRHDSVSIRAPQSPAGRQYPPPPLPPQAGFNPRPAVSCGATYQALGSRRALYNVSIRAPQSPAGRRQDRWFDHWTIRFQSAPRSLLRGDKVPIWTSICSRKFQSAPRSLLRGDRKKGSSFTTVSSFQSAPRSLLRGDSLRMSWYG